LFSICEEVRAMKAPLQVVVLAILVVVVAFAAAQAPPKPVSEQDLVSMVGLGFEADDIVTRVKKAGITFEPTDAALAKLKVAGLADAVLAAVKAEGARSKPADPAAPVTYDQVMQSLSLGMDEDSILGRLSKSPTTFTLSAQQVAALKQAGATEKVLAAMQGLRAPSAKSSDITDLAIILDVSGSMQELTTGREMKMTAAKRVVTDLVNKIPEGLNVTFVIYGHEVFGGAEDPRNCQAVKVARPLSPLDANGKAELTQLISRLQPKGSTPIALSLRTAGEELRKNNALCGLVLITDGVETCNGNPAAEAAALAANLKLTFGVNVVGFGVKPEENASLKAIADAGHGKYYSADDATKLAEFVAAIAKEIQEVAKPAETVDVSRRALKILQPEIELPAMKEIFLVEAGRADHGGVYTKVASITKYGEYLPIPSSTKKYDVVWVPATGRLVHMMRDVMLAERKVVNVKPETIFGLVKVSGSGKVNSIIAMPAGNRPVGVFTPVSSVEKYGDILVMPAGKYDIHVGLSSGTFTTLEEDLQVEAGKQVNLQN
jgi:Mg-chelatase subunit ChlD